MDKYKQMDMILPTQKVYGLGERHREFELNEGTWTMWARSHNGPDGTTMYDNGEGGK